MDLTEGSETSAKFNQTPGKYPKENIQKSSFLSSEKFGLFAVDFHDPARPRTPKESAKVLAEIIRTREIPERFRHDYI
jgi:hypothetical protein